MASENGVKGEARKSTVDFYKISMTIGTLAQALSFLRFHVYLGHKGDME